VLNHAAQRIASTAQQWKPLDCLATRLLLLLLLLGAEEDR
jgi:hypothetical protein